MNNNKIHPNYMNKKNRINNNWCSKQSHQQWINSSNKLILTKTGTSLRNKYKDLYSLLLDKSGISPLKQKILLILLQSLTTIETEKLVKKKWENLSSVFLDRSSKNNDIRKGNDDFCFILNGNMIKLFYFIKIWD